MKSIATYLLTPAGKRRLAKAMVAPHTITCPECNMSWPIKRYDYTKDGDIVHPAIPKSHSQKECDDAAKEYRFKQLLG